ncbi:MAG: hypothetical protein NTW55_01190 [Planctomycetota bacterium]|nr:hypothetical protein [Planctomycetota bacterium]
MKLKSVLKYVAMPAGVFSTLAVLLLIVLAVQGIVWGLLITFMNEGFEQHPAKVEDPNTRVSRSDKKFLPDGTVHLISVVEQKGRQELWRERIYDVNDNLLWEGIRKDRPYKYLTWAEYPNQSITESWMRELGMITPEFSQALEIPVSLDGRTIEAWRYDPQRQRFVGYEIKGNKIGYLGTGGFTETKSQVMPFGKFKLFTGWVPKDSFSPTLFWQTDKRIYQINFEGRKVDLLFEIADGEIANIRMKNWGASATGKTETAEIEYRPMIYCRLGGEGDYHLILREPQQELTVTIPNQRQGASFTATRQGIFFSQGISDANPPATYEQSPEIWTKYWNDYRKKTHKRGIELYRVENDGRILLVNRFEWIKPADYSVPEVDLSWRSKRHLTIISPPAYDLCWYLGMDKVARLQAEKTVVTDVFAQLLEWWRPGKAAVNWVLSIALMGFTLWHGWARRTSWVKLVFWIVFAGLFSLAGFLTYWALNHTPVIKCPLCGKSRGLERINCARCGLELPRPERRKLDLILNS